MDLSDGDEVDAVDCIILIIIFLYISGSCGSCGYELNLNSCNRNISAIDSKYGKSMKRGVISFFSIDESRFTQVNKLQLLPYFTSKSSWRLFRRRTKLLCRNCGNYIGTVSPFHLVKSNSEAWDGISACRTYDIKIGSLRPMSSEESSVFLWSQLWRTLVTLSKLVWTSGNEQEVQIYHRWIIVYYWLRSVSFS